MRVDVVFDVYNEDSLKGETRRKVTGILSGNMRGTLFFSAMKTKLNSSFVADTLVFNNIDFNIVVTKEENVVNNTFIAPCNHEEADTHMFLHAKHGALGSIKSVKIVSYDTDVLVKGVVVYDEALDNIWKRRRFALDAHSIVRSLGPRSKALPFFHVFTSCGTVSTFFGIGKKTAWQAWNVFENATEVCRCLSSLCGNFPENEIGVFEEFVAIMYGRSTSTNKVNEAHLDLFARTQRPYNGIPSSKLEDLKVLRRSPDLLNNVVIGQCKLQLIMEQILFYHIGGGGGGGASDLT